MLILVFSILIIFFVFIFIVIILIIWSVEPIVVLEIRERLYLRLEACVLEVFLQALASCQPKP